MTRRGSPETGARMPLFVYGTLRPGLAPEALRERVARLDVLGAARLRGRLYDLGTHPAAVPDPLAPDWIHGELLSLPDLELAWSWMDAYEGYDPADPKRSLFVRTRTLTLRQDARPASCWIYVYNRDPAGLPLVPDGDWISKGTRSSSREARPRPAGPGAK